MESQEEAKNLITDAKNICIIPSPTNEPESLSVALALFYTLKELGKNVNLINQDFPENLGFLIPSLDFISQPKNIIISIPHSIADISQVYYEKNEENLKIHLTIEKGSLKKDDISFYFSNARPDLIITLGIKDFKKELENKLDSFGFLLDSPILNIDSSALPVTNTMDLLNVSNQENTIFGKINILEEKSISQIVIDLIKSISDRISKDTASCILTGLILHYKNFQNLETTPEIFELCAYLMKQGASRQEIVENLYKIKNQDMPFKKLEEIIIS